MTSRQEVKLNMYNSVITHCSQNQRVAETIPALETSMAALKTTVTAITTTVQQQLQAIKGHTQGKAEGRQALCTFANEVAGALFAYATDKKDAVMKAKVKTSFSALRRLRDEELAPVCRIYLDMATANEAALADYGLLPAVIASFKAAIESYYTTVPAPRNAVALRSAYKKSLAALFASADDILKNKIDKLSLPLKKSNTDFMNAYSSNRRIIDTGGIATQLKITITGPKDTDGVISGALVKIAKLGIEAVTNKQGQLLLKPVQQGEYAIEISKEGYQPQTITEVKITRGQANAVEVALKKTA
jgi:Carboxypeptidase regulatory-like domain